MKTDNGFTLVELAIVMTIIGLLIGGILKGQELLENARVTSTIAQVKSYDAAITGFRDIYDALPGDLVNAADKIPGCNENCTPSLDASLGVGSAGDGSVSYKSAGVDCVDGVNTATTLPPAHPQDESYLMWVHLLKTNFITGVSDVAIHEAVSRSFGNTDPAAKIGGGFIPGTDMCANSGTVNGLSLTLDSGFHNLVDAGNGDYGLHQAAMTPARAAQIDRKMDDGRPQSGTIKAIGNMADYCDTVDNEYLEQVATKDCSLIIGVQQ